ncbi:MAG: tRNA (adenosine(37)-N6)-threonylcarbamoyltransferase complex transferase subunit TsaD, partial [Pseudomonadota bacterium]
GPGLIGGLLVGSGFPRGLAAAADKPFIAVNHLEAHVLSPRLAGDLEFPYLALLLSGGHCQIVDIRALGDYRTLGATIDDAVGEAFDKAAKMLGLGYPGGPALERAAADGDADRFKLPRPLKGRPGCDFSFSGLKTAVRRTIEAHRGGFDARAVDDLAAGFQAAVCDVLADRLRKALAIAPRNAVAVVGGVAANAAIRGRIETVCDAAGARCALAPLWLCGDNAAMVAWAGAERARIGLFDPLDAPCRPRWPLDDLRKVTAATCSTG